MELNKKAD